LNAFAQHAAFSSHHHGLILIPDLPPSRGVLDILDPLPGLRQVVEHPEKWPGVVFWLKSGASAFAPLHEAYELYQQLLTAFSSRGESTEKIIEAYNARSLAKSTKTLLQLSDVHFGSQFTFQNEAYLSARLQTVVPEVDRVVITGDLF